MTFIRPVLNLVSGGVFIGMGCWELVTVKRNPSTAFDINDVVMCFIYTIGIFNLIMGCASFYICAVQFKDPERSDRYAVNISTGISIWGLILYFRYASLISPLFYKIVLAEMITFFSRIGLILILVCGSCLKQEEVIPSVTEK